VRLSDIAEVSFWTSTPATESTSPFYLVLYTARDGVEDGGWFGYRLHALPQAAVGVEAAGEAWTKWSTAGSANALRFADEPTLGTFAAPGLPSLAELQGTPAFDWSARNGAWPATAIDYAGEAMRFVSIQTGSGFETTGTDARLHLVTLTLTDGRSLVLDLEP
jgi:hypothetical protein